MKTKYDPEHTARLLLINLQRYADEKSKDYSRFRCSKPTLRSICGRAKLYPSFLEELQEEFLQLGWQMFESGDGEFAFIRGDKLVTWPKVGRQRITNSMGEVQFGSLAEIQVAFEKIPYQAPQAESSE